MTWRHSSRESTLAPKSLRCPWLVTKFSEDTILTAGLIIVPKNVQNCNYDVVKRVLYNITIKTFELPTVQWMYVIHFRYLAYIHTMLYFPWWIPGRKVTEFQHDRRTYIFKNTYLFFTRKSSKPRISSCWISDRFTTSNSPVNQSHNKLRELKHLLRSSSHSVMNWKFHLAKSSTSS